VEASEADPLDEAVALVREADRAGIPLRLVGGLAVRFLCPGFPPRAREAQDLDLASVSRARPQLVGFLEARGFVPDRFFNNLYGHKQLYFTSPDGRRGLDVLLDKVDMCHVLEFRDRLERLPVTLDATDLLLSKLQIVELNEKDLQDAIYLLAALPVREGDEPGTIGLGRFCAVVGDDWGWWRTVTGNLDRILGLSDAVRARLLPPDPPHDPVEQARVLREAADAVPKSLRWRLRARVGERLPWYKLPEEVAHR
jgi:hypothetical protein